MTISTETTTSAEKDPVTAPEIEIGRGDLPLACPRARDGVWNQHPRVYLPIEKTGKATCPYCGTRYRFAD